MADPVEDRLDRPLRFTEVGTEIGRQGRLIDARDGKLYVAFEEDDVWDSDGKTYTIDIGNDDASYKLQKKALDNLFYDPIHQKSRNDKHIEGAQVSFRNGIISSIREWTLQGTALRDKLVFASEKRETESSEEVETTETLKARPLFRDNQFINSWILRHNRDKPMTMPGDPDFGVNTSQLRAIAMALHEDLSLIQGVSFLRYLCSLC